jgi:hypothetical protein
VKVIGRRLTGLRSTVLAIAFVAVINAGCALSDEARPTTVNPQTDRPLPTYFKTGGATLEPQSENPCIEEPIPGQAHALTDLAHRSRVIAIVTFKGYGAPFWTTADGHRPSHEEVLRDGPIITRPIVLADAEMLRANAQDLTNAREGGGKIGCDFVSFGGTRDMEVGRRYVIFFFDEETFTGSPAVVSSVLDALPLDGSDIAEAFLEGPTPLGQIRLLIKDNSYLPDLAPAAATASPAQFWRAELDSVFAHVSAQVPSLLEQGYPLVSIAIDDVIDRVVIGIHPYDESTADALRAMFGPAVLVKEREPFHQL